MTGSISHSACKVRHIKGVERSRTRGVHFCEMVQGRCRAAVYVHCTCARGGPPCRAVPGP